MSREASINLLKESVKIHTDMLDELEKRYASLRIAIPGIKKELEKDKEELARLQQIGGGL